MSRLESAIARLQAQKVLLEAGLGRIGGRAGCVFEVGLGNGRTYDHLRTLAPDREIYVFERCVRAHFSCVPPADFLVEGDAVESLRGWRGEKALLCHIDIGSGRAEMDREVVEALEGVLPGVLRAGAIVIHDQPLQFEGLEGLPLPAGVAEGRYGFGCWS